MNNSIQQMQSHVYQAIARGQYDEAILLCSRFITLSEDTSSDEDMSILFAERAGYFVLLKKFEDSLSDSEIAISLDAHNALGHFQKAKALLHLHKVKEAREAIRVGRSVTNDHQLFDELERNISNSWFTLGHKGLKFITTLVLTVAVGLLTNLIGGLSGWKQAMVVMVLCLVVFFIRFHLLLQFFIHMFYAFQHNCIWRFLRMNSSTTSSTDNTTQNNAYVQSDTNRF